MKKISAVFQTNVTNIEADIARLKKEADTTGQVACIASHSFKITNETDLGFLCCPTVS
jgi:hypothetical protein